MIITGLIKDLMILIAILMKMAGTLPSIQPTMQSSDWQKLRTISIINSIKDYYS